MFFCLAYLSFSRCNSLSNWLSLITDDTIFGWKIVFLFFFCCTGTRRQGRGVAGQTTRQPTRLLRDRRSAVQSLGLPLVCKRQRTTQLSPDPVAALPSLKRGPVNLRRCYHYCLFFFFLKLTWNWKNKVKHCLRRSIPNQYTCTERKPMICYWFYFIGRNEPNQLNYNF